MGLRKESIYLLMQEGLRKPFKGRLVTLGRQDVSATQKDVESLASALHYPLQEVETIEYSEKEDMKEDQLISDRTLFAMLGFTQIESMDVSNYENADIIFDLNSPDLPAELQGAFEVVLDPGSIEHVFHLPNALKNIFQLLSVGGRAIHIAPSSNHVDHGFYMFSPTFFRDYYCANGFPLHQLQVIRYQPQLVHGWEIANYCQEKFHPFSFGGFDRYMYAIYCVASKEEGSTYDKIPQQFHYVHHMWSEQGRSQGGLARYKKLKRFVKKSKFLYRISIALQRLQRQWKLRRLFRDKVGP